MSIFCIIALHSIQVSFWKLSKVYISINTILLLQISDNITIVHVKYRLSLDNLFCSRAKFVSRNRRFDSHAWATDPSSYPVSTKWKFRIRIALAWVATVPLLKYMNDTSALEKQKCSPLLRLLYIHIYIYVCIMWYSE